MDASLQTKERPPQIPSLTYNPFSKGNVTAVILLDGRRGMTIDKIDRFPVKYRITYDRKAKYYDAGFPLTEKEFKALGRTKSQTVISDRTMIENKYNIILSHIEDLLKNHTFSFEALDKRIGRGDSEDVIVAFDQKIARLKANGQVGTAMVYECTKNSLEEFYDNDNLKFSRINPEWLKDYEDWFIHTKITKKEKTRSYATLSIYIRSLRSIFNEAKQQGSINESGYPFGRGKYEIPNSAGRKMAYNLEQIGTLMNIGVKQGDSKDKMRDLWLFSYLCNGMNVKDMVCLKWENIGEDEICYIREKTARTTRDKKPISAPILPKMREVLERWGIEDKKPNSYVFGYLTGKPTPEMVRKVTQNLTRQMNKNLKSMTKGAKLPAITSYTARHSYATVLQRSGASVEFISESLGHKDTKTTRNYLAGFEAETRRKMNTNLTDYVGGK